MPELSRFYGIVIRMYYDDHPPPHFHAYRGEHAVTVSLDTGLIEGRFPRRALGFVLEWYMLHRGELRDNWQLVLTREPLLPIEPLE